MRAIDVMHLGRDRVICCWQVGDVLIDPGPSSTLPALLAALGDERPRALYLTHIHLDHAGASGSLVRRWPDLQVYVHERGAPHMINPEKLMASASRLYGEDMDRRWGEMVPVPEANVHVLRGGEELDGGFEVAYTPGHASHHVSYLHHESGTAFVGDVGGVRIPPSPLALPPTPPPDIDLELWRSSIDLVSGWRPRQLAMTHFGAAEDVQEQLAQVSRRLDEWGAFARDHDEAGFIEAITEEISNASDTGTAASFIQAAPPEQLYAGLRRYWDKKADAS